MGFKQTWYAIQNSTREDVLKTTKLKPTGHSEDFPESPIVGAYLPNGNYILISSDWESISTDTQEKILNNYDVIMGQAYENVNISSLSHWINGKNTWLINHNGSENGCDHIETEGEVPAAFHPIHQKILEELASYGEEEPDVDAMFEAPVELGQALVGYKYCQDTPGMGENAFEVLEEFKEPETLWKKIINKLF